METTLISTQKGNITVCRLGEGERISSVSDFLDILANCRGNTIAISKTDLTPDFFDLKTGVAGEYLQKVSNYTRRLIILGDYTDVTSKSLRDFIYESNKTGKVIFAADLESAVSLLK